MLSDRQIGSYANLALQEICPGATFRTVPSFGENVRRLRREAGFKRSKELAARLNVAASVVSRWENDATGLPEGPTLLRLAIALRCSVEDLLLGVDPDYDALVKPRELTRRFLRPTLAEMEAAEAAEILAGMPDAQRSAWLTLLRPHAKGSAGAANGNTPHADPPVASGSAPRVHRAGRR